MEYTKEEKLKLIESQGIQYIESTEYSLDSIFEFALVKDVISTRLVAEPECLGNYDEQDTACAKCLFHVNGLCEKYKKYNKFCVEFPNADNAIQVGVWDSKGAKIKMEDLNLYLPKLCLRESSSSFKIAKVILESDGVSYPDILQKIMQICGPEAKLSYAKSRFSQIKKIIHERTDLKVGILTKKYVHIMKDIKKC